MTFEEVCPCDSIVEKLHITSVEIISIRINTVFNFNLLALKLKYFNTCLAEEINIVSVYNWLSNHIGYQIFDFIIL